MRPNIEARDSLLDVSRRKVFLRRWEVASPGGSPIILLHDSLGSVALWRGFPRALARITARSVIAYDRTGFGWSAARTDKPGPDFIHEEAASFLPELLAMLSIERCVLFGHSVGGGIAVAAAAVKPACYNAVITESAQAFIEARTLDGIRVARQKFADPQRFAKLVRWHGDRARWVLDAWTEVWLSPQLASWNLDGYLQRANCPLLAMHGNADEFGSVEFPRRIVSKAGGPAEMVIIERCGHVPHREQPKTVLETVAAFLRRVG
jgi:pimeloyl-ACP methyl ester carboxylesterase